MRPSYKSVENPDLTMRIDIFDVSKSWRAMLKIAADRFKFPAKKSGLVFFRLLGTGTGQTFTSADANYHRWVVLTVWQNQSGADAFAKSKIIKSWLRISHNHAYLMLAPISSKGHWAKQTPFGNPIPNRWDGPVLSITRARIKAKMWRRFQSEVPPVSNSLHSSPGLLTAFGIGEAPIGLQGTLSIWHSNRELTEFAQRASAHRVVIARTHELNWYAEELFARFAILTAHGALDGVPLAQLNPTG